MDSDKDGKSNGEELGDPNCTWQPAQTPAGHAIGHPGIVFFFYTYFRHTKKSDLNMTNVIIKINMA